MKDKYFSIGKFQHGESELNQQQRIGGDPSLSTNGKLVGLFDREYVVLSI